MSAYTERDVLRRGKVLRNRSRTLYRGRTAEQWAEHIGITVQGFWQRLRRYGEDDDRTYSTAIKRGCPKYEPGCPEWFALGTRDRSERLAAIPGPGRFERGEL